MLRNLGYKLEEFNTHCSTASQATNPMKEACFHMLVQFLEFITEAVNTIREDDESTSTGGRSSLTQLSVFANYSVPSRQATRAAGVLDTARKTIQCCKSGVERDSCAARKAIDNGWIAHLSALNFHCGKAGAANSLFHITSHECVKILQPRGRIREY